VAGTREIEISGETIRLGQLLKLAGIARSGGEAKLLLAGSVLVNGAAETRRGRRLQRGDTIEADGETVKVA
jgi:ribosome-associated protein